VGACYVFKTNCLLCLSCQHQVELGIETEGSNLSGVSGHCIWQEWSASHCNADPSYYEGSALHSKENSESADKNERDRNVEDGHAHLSSRG
jgi:Suppressor of Fused Gli/Ci N terminal binding domain